VAVSPARGVATGPRPRGKRPGYWRPEKHRLNALRNVSKPILPGRLACPASLSGNLPLRQAALGRDGGVVGGLFNRARASGRAPAVFRPCARVGQFNTSVAFPYVRGVGGVIPPRGGAAREGPELAGLAGQACPCPITRCCPREFGGPQAPPTWKRSKIAALRRHPPATAEESSFFFLGGVASWPVFCTRTPWTRSGQGPPASAPPSRALRLLSSTPWRRPAGQLVRARPQGNSGPPCANLTRHGPPGRERCFLFLFFFLFASHPNPLYISRPYGVNPPDCLPRLSTAHRRQRLRRCPPETNQKPSPVLTSREPSPPSGNGRRSRPPPPPPLASYPGRPGAPAGCRFGRGPFPWFVHHRPVGGRGIAGHPPPTRTGDRVT